jgi:hypothetical protein
LFDEQDMPLLFNLGESYKKMFFEKFSWLQFFFVSLHISFHLAAEKH